MKKTECYIQNRCFLLLVVLCMTTGMNAQSIKDIRINEIQVFNTHGLLDEFGQRSSWFELYNAGYGKVDVSGCVLKVKDKEYKIPKGDPKTVIPTQGFLLFYAGEVSNKGTFYTNFTLEKTDFIEFYDTDGHLIDRFDFIPQEMIENVSYGWLQGHDGIERLANLPAITPLGSNNTEEKISRAEQFRQADPSGIVLTIISIAIVAIALTILFFIFKYMGEFHINMAVKKKEKAKKISNANAVTVLATNKKSAVTNDELAVIAIAIFKYSQEMHDYENTILTINRAAKIYSPWSSKIYGLTQVPNKK